MPPTGTPPMLTPSAIVAFGGAVAVVVGGAVAVVAAVLGDPGAGPRGPPIGPAAKTPPRRTTPVPSSTNDLAVITRTSLSMLRRWAPRQSVRHVARASSCRCSRLG